MHYPITLSFWILNQFVVKDNISYYSSGVNHEELLFLPVESKWDDGGKRKIMLKILEM